MIPAAPATTDLKSAMEDVRASVAAQEADSRLAALIRDAFVKILEVLMAMLADFRSGRLTAAADAGRACAAEGEDAAYAARDVRGEPAGSRPDHGGRGWWLPAWLWWHGCGSDRALGGVFAGVAQERRTLGTGGNRGHDTAPPRAGLQARRSGDDGSLARGRSLHGARAYDESARSGLRRAARSAERNGGTARRADCAGMVGFAHPTVRIFQKSDLGWRERRGYIVAT